MVGLIQMLLFDMARSLGGQEAVKAIKHSAGVDENKEYRIDEDYDDEEWQRLFKSTCEILQITQEKAEVVYADYFFKDGLKRWKTWFDMSKSAREFLERQPAIHNNFASGVRNQESRSKILDKFNLEKKENELIVHYVSPNQHCGLYIELAKWILNHYGDSAEIHQSHCLKNGDPECTIHIGFHKP